MDISSLALSTEECIMIQKLLSKSDITLLTIEDIWGILDKEWDKMGCDNRQLDWTKIENFYKSPV